KLEPDTRIAFTTGIHHRLTIVDAKIIVTDAEQPLHGTPTAHADVEDWLALRQRGDPIERSLFGRTQFRRTRVLSDYRCIVHGPHVDAVYRFAHVPSPSSYPACEPPPRCAPCASYRVRHAVSYAPYPSWRRQRLVNSSLSG